ncbi:MAG: hypothetical protein KDD99_24955, partial [Bacteroidetes bacterium]|nr:hypothetical protein [Bacteroidota bacterium]
MHSKNYLPFILFLTILISWNLSTKAQTMTFNVENETVASGTVDISITVNSFVNITGYQGTIRFDTAYLDFVSLSSPTASINNIFGNPGMGLIPLDAATFTWVDFSGTGATLADGSEVMRISFMVKNSTPPGTYPVTMDGSVTSLAYTTGTGLITPLVNQGSVTVNCIPTANPNFSYLAFNCINGPNPQATLLGDPGGIFTVDQGATIDPVTGMLDLSTTMPGVPYTITYTVGAICPASGSVTISPIAGDDASFLFSDTVCINDFNPAAIITGTTGGTFSVDNGASINPNTGVLDLTTTTPNTTYTISYQTSGFCSDTSLETIFVSGTANASFAYEDSICITDFDPSATITGDLGGVFSVDNGASIDPLTGALDLTTTTSGTTYTVTYSVGAGNCSDAESRMIAVIAEDDPSFTFPDTVCINGSNPVPVVTGDPGTFSHLFGPAFTVNASTGEVDLSSLTPGTTYTLSHDTEGFCSTFKDHPFYVQDSMDASFTYPE